MPTHRDDSHISVVVWQSFDLVSCAPVLSHNTAVMLYCGTAGGIPDPKFRRTHYNLAASLYLSVTYLEVVTLEELDTTATSSKESAYQAQPKRSSLNLTRSLPDDLRQDKICYSLNPYI